jgi:hypothetical protein
VVFGKDTAAAEDQLAFATADGWAILTRNIRDFAPLHEPWQAAGRPHTGIIVSQQVGQSPIRFAARTPHALAQPLHRGRNGWELHSPGAIQIGFRLGKKGPEKEPFQVCGLNFSEY